MYLPCHIKYLHTIKLSFQPTTMSGRSCTPAVPAATVTNAAAAKLAAMAQDFPTVHAYYKAAYVPR